jgi:hypothetical protein
MSEQVFGGEAQFRATPKEIPANSLLVHITHEPFLPWFTLTLEDGSSEELEPEDTRTWFKERGANMDAVEKALDHAWNLTHSKFMILNPKKPMLDNPNLDPKI